MKYLYLIGLILLAVSAQTADRYYIGNLPGSYSDASTYTIENQMLIDVHDTSLYSGTIDTIYAKINNSGLGSSVCSVVVGAYDVNYDIIGCSDPFVFDYAIVAEWHAWPVNIPIDSGRIYLTILGNAPADFTLTARYYNATTDKSFYRKAATYSDGCPAALTFAALDPSAALMIYASVDTVSAKPQIIRITEE